MTNILCPRCKETTLKQNSARNALSRRDNETQICASCGTREALEDSRLVPAWHDAPYWNVNSEVWKAQAGRTA